MVANKSPQSGHAIRVLTVLLLSILLPMLSLSSRVRAEVLPVKTYTSADGLLRDVAYCIVQDSRGFLWFCTSDGLSRFDGYGFTNYTTDDGLPHRVVNAFLESRSGIYWVATNDGLARFNPKGRRGQSGSIGNRQSLQSVIGNESEPMFAIFKPPDNEDAREITALFEDSHGVLWCGTVDGLYQIEEKQNQVIFHRIDLQKDRPNVKLSVSAIIQDNRGNLWIGMDLDQGINRILPGGRIEHFSTRRNEKKNRSIKTLLQTNDGEIWAGMSIHGGLCSLASEPNAQLPIFSRCLTRKHGLPSDWVTSLYQTSDGKLWVATTGGAVTIDNLAELTNQIRVYKESEGLCEQGFHAFQEDRDGNLWVSTNCGIKKITRSGFVRFRQADGLAPLGVTSIFTSRSGELFVITKDGLERNQRTLAAVHTINRFDNNRFIFVTPKLPQNAGTGWGGGQIVVQDKTGAWWLPSDQQAIYRFPKTSVLSELANLKPQAISIPDKEVFRIYEDSRSDIWISTTYDGHLLKWERSTETLHDFHSEIGGRGYATYFVEDRSGNLWIGFDYGESKLEARCHVEN